MENLTCKRQPQLSVRVTAKKTTKSPPIPAESLATVWKNSPFPGGKREKKIVFSFSLILQCPFSTLNWQSQTSRQLIKGENSRVHLKYFYIFLQVHKFEIIWKINTWVYFHKLSNECVNRCSITLLRKE